MATLIKAGKLIDGKGGSIDRAAVLIEADRIVAVGRQADRQSGAGEKGGHHPGGRRPLDGYHGPTAGRHGEEGWSSSGR